MGIEPRISQMGADRADISSRVEQSTCHFIRVNPRNPRSITSDAPNNLGRATIGPMPVILRLAKKTLHLSTYRRVDPIAKINGVSRVPT
jgi:hypothetical protein